jgi:hypothetical protein
MEITLIAKLLCVTFAFIYKIVAWIKKERNDQQHYHLMSEVYVVGLFVLICITEVGNKHTCKKESCKEFKTDTTKIK